MNFLGVKVLNNPDNLTSNQILNALDAMELELDVPMGCGESTVKVQLSYELQTEEEPHSGWL